MDKNVKAPIAKKIAFEINQHGEKRIDDYFWMRLSDEQKEAEQKQRVKNYKKKQQNDTKKRKPKKY